MFVPREIPAAVSALAEIAIVERDSKGGKRVIRRPEQLSRAIRAYSQGAVTGTVARRVAAVAIEIGELDAGEKDGIEFHALSAPAPWFPMKLIA